MGGKGWTADHSHSRPRRPRTGLSVDNTTLLINLYFYCRFILHKERCQTQRLLLNRQLLQMNQQHHEEERDRLKVQQHAAPRLSVLLRKGTLLVNLIFPYVHVTQSTQSFFSWLTRKSLEY